MLFNLAATMANVGASQVLTGDGYESTCYNNV